MTNPLVATPTDSTTWHTGMGWFDYAVTAKEDIGKGDMLGATMNGGAAALGALAAISDPLGYAISAGVGWVLEHCPFFRDILDWLGGKPDVINSFAQTWTNVSERLNKVGDDVLTLLERETADWISVATDAYKATMKNQALLVKAAGEAASGVSTATTVAGVVVAIVRATVRDFIAEAIGAIISKALQAATVVLIPKAIVEIGMLVTKWSLKILAKVKEVIAAIGRISHTTSALKPIFKALDDAAQNVARVHAGRLSAWIQTTITPGNKFVNAFDDITKFNKAAGHGHVPALAPNFGANAATTSTNPSHIGVDKDPSRDNDGGFTLDFDL